MPPGRYSNLTINKSLTLTSLDPEDPEIVSKTFLKKVSLAGSDHVRISGFTFHFVDHLDIPAGTTVEIDHNRFISNWAMSNGLTDTPEPGRGGAVHGGVGSIHHNLFLHNVAALGGAIYGFNGRIAHNLFVRNAAEDFTYGDHPFGPFRLYTGSGSSLFGCTGSVENNTFVSRQSYPIIHPHSDTWRNNLFFWSRPLPGNTVTPIATSSYDIYSSAPADGIHGLQGEDRFVDPAHDDFRLWPGSVAIDAGCSVTLSETDFAGHPRGIRGIDEPRGDASLVDVGAFEYTPADLFIALIPGENLPFPSYYPVAHVPAVEPFYEGSPLRVRWAASERSGSRIFIDLFRNDQRVARLGAAESSDLEGFAEFTVPFGLDSGKWYRIVATSANNSSIRDQTPRFNIQGTSLVAHESSAISSPWHLYP